MAMSWFTPYCCFLPNLSLSNLNLDCRDGLVSAMPLVLKFSSHMASASDATESGSKWDSPHLLYVFFFFFFFCLPVMCHLPKKTQPTGQSLAGTLWAVSVMQKVTLEPAHLFCMQLRASQLSWLSKAPRAPLLICFSLFGLFFIPQQYLPIFI